MKSWSFVSTGALVSGSFVVIAWIASASTLSSQNFQMQGSFSFTGSTNGSSTSYATKDSTGQGAPRTYITTVLPVTQNTTTVRRRTEVGYDSATTPVVATPATAVAEELTPPTSSQGSTPASSGGNTSGGTTVSDAETIAPAQEVIEPQRRSGGSIAEERSPESSLPDQPVVTQKPRVTNLATRQGVGQEVSGSASGYVQESSTESGGAGEPARQDQGEPKAQTVVPDTTMISKVSTAIQKTTTSFWSRVKSATRRVAEAIGSGAKVTGRVVGQSAHWLAQITTDAFQRIVQWFR